MIALLLTDNFFCFQARIGPILLSMNSYSSLPKQSSRFSSDMVCLQSSVRQAVARLTDRGIPQSFVLRYIVN